jgi:hypothetical protein
MEEAGMRARLTAGLGLIGLIAALWVAPAASASTATIGAAALPSDTLFAGCSSPCDYMQETTAAGSPSYVVPPVPAGQPPWSITSWSALGGAGDGSAALDVWRPTGSPDEFRLISVGDQLPFPTNVLTSHAVSIPVLPGDHLGVRAGDSDFQSVYQTSNIGDAWLSPHELAAVGETAGGSSSDHTPSRSADERVNVQATLTSTPAAAAPTTNSKCKKKKHKRSASSAKKKKCKKHKKK